MQGLNKNNIIYIEKGGKKTRENQLTREAQEFDKATLSEKQLTSLESMKKGHGYSNKNNEEELIDASDLPPIEIMISEKLFLTFDRDGAMKKFEIKGDMEVAVNDPSIFCAGGGGTQSP